jgi:hypothetical protein
MSIEQEAVGSRDKWAPGRGNLVYPHQRQAVEVAVSEIHNRFKTGFGKASNRRSVLA